MEDELWSRFRQRLDAILIPFEGQIAYGDLRREISEWGEGEGRTTNVAIIYETPGGSSNQINITYRHRCGRFSILDPSLHSERDISDLEELFAIIQQYLREIPGKRKSMLENYIRGWREQGFSRQQALQSLRQFLRPMDLKGGSITEGELSHAARFTVRLYRQQG